MIESNHTRIALSAFTAFGVKVRRAAMHMIIDCLNAAMVNRLFVKGFECLVVGKRMNLGEKSDMQR